MISKGALLSGFSIVLGGALTWIGGPARDVDLANVAEIWWAVVRDADQAGLQLTRVSAREEMDFGGRLARGFLQHQTIDSAWQGYLQDVGNTVARQARRKDLQYRFHAVAHPSVNAFALPGGQIVVFTGLLDSLQSEAELATVLGHEIAHVDARHAVERYQYQLRLKTVGLDSAGQMADLVRTLAVTGYKQYQEFEADDFGAQFALEAGYDPRHGEAFLKRMSGGHTASRARTTPAEEMAGAAVSVLTDYFRSHPASEQRSARMRHYIEQELKQRAGATLYAGGENLRRRVARSVQDFPHEHVRP